MKFTVAAVAAGFAASAAAAITARGNVPSLGDVPKCAFNCVISGLPPSCKFDPECICKDTSFIDDMSCCIIKACPSEEEQSNLMTFAHQVCDQVGVSIPTTISCSKDAPKTTSVAEPTTTAAPETTEEAKPTTTEAAVETTAEETSAAVTSAAAATSEAATSEAATSEAATSAAVESTAAVSTAASVEATTVAPTSAAATHVLPSEATTLATSVPAVASTGVVNGGHAAPSSAPLAPESNGAAAVAANAGALAVAAAALLL